MENYLGEGTLVCIELTAGSNIAVGTPVCVNTGSNTSVPQVYSIGAGVAGVSASTTMGMRCIGVLADNVSAGDCPCMVYTEGIFRFQMSTASLQARISPGVPVFPDSGIVVITPGSEASTSGSSGQGSLGVIVGMSGAGATGGNWVDVKLNPGAYRWTVYSAVVSATNSLGLTWGGNTNT